MDTPESMDVRHEDGSGATTNAYDSNSVDDEFADRVSVDSEPVRYVRLGWDDSLEDPLIKYSAAEDSSADDDCYGDYDNIFEDDLGEPLYMETPVDLQSVSSDEFTDCRSSFSEDDIKEPCNMKSGVDLNSFSDDEFFDCRSSFFEDDLKNLTDPKIPEGATFGGGEQDNLQELLDDYDLDLPYPTSIGGTPVGENPPTYVTMVVSKQPLPMPMTPKKLQRTSSIVPVAECSAIPIDQMPPTPEQTPSKTLKRRADIESTSPSGIKRHATDVGSPTPVFTKQQSPSNTAPTTGSQLFRNVPEYSILYKKPARELNVSAFELKRISEAVLCQIDWEYVAEYTASNRGRATYKSTVKGLLQAKINELFNTEKEANQAKH